LAVVSAGNPELGGQADRDCGRRLGRRVAVRICPAAVGARARL